LIRGSQSFKDVLERNIAEGRTVSQNSKVEVNLGCLRDRKSGSRKREGPRGEIINEVGEVQKPVYIKS
jgi:hypothetical protein